MTETVIGADELVRRLLKQPADEPISLLDSCGTHSNGSHLLIAGLGPTGVLEIEGGDPDESLARLEKAIEASPVSFFTLSYDLGRKLNGVSTWHGASRTMPEPDIYLATYDSVIVHDYKSGRTRTGGANGALRSLAAGRGPRVSRATGMHRTKRFHSSAVSDASGTAYRKMVEQVRELIRAGETYQTNVTQRFEARLGDGLTPSEIFLRLRRDHPAAFSAFFRRREDHIVSISPERFLKVASLRPRNAGISSALPADAAAAVITASPIKGTRRRGATPKADRAMKEELLSSAKDRAENTMIVDLMRNDLGRVCEYGSVYVEQLCRIETLPSLFHLVSTIKGRIRVGMGFSDILRAAFPCGSITGCPKIRTMEIIDALETSRRGLSMGAIGYAISGEAAAEAGLVNAPDDAAYHIDLSVAIRTLTIRDRIAAFCVGGGVVIDSDPMREYEESLDKAGAILNALGADLPEEESAGA